MKLVFRIIPPLLFTFALSHAQDDLSEVSRESKFSPGTLSAARIIGEIPDGTLSLEAAPKPEYPVPVTDILSTTTHEQGGRTITIQEITPISLPLLAVVAPQPSVLNVESSQSLTEHHEESSESGMLALSATIYLPKDGPPRTLVRYSPEGGHKVVTFWSSADFSLIAGGINSFVDATGTIYHIMMSWEKVDIAQLSDVSPETREQYGIPNIPALPEGKATFQVIGEQAAAEEIAPIQALHDIYNNELPQLKAAYEGRERARIEQEEYLKANPPQPKDITINFWRTEKPASNEKGGDK